MGPRKYSDDQLRRAVASSSNVRQVLTRLGLVGRGGNYETVRRRIKELGIDGSHLTPRYVVGVRVSSIPDDEIVVAIETSRTLSEARDKLGIRPGRGQSQLRERLETLGLDTSHFVGQGWRGGPTVPPVPPRPLSELLVEGRLAHSSNLRLRLIREGIKDASCEACGGESWNGRPIPLELDHINGRRDDNRLTNLRLLCPNCHAQTPSYRGRNIGRVS